jgi:hypothetical protein
MQPSVNPHPPLVAPSTATPSVPAPVPPSQDEDNGLGDIGTWLSFVRERSGTVDTDLSSYSLRSQPPHPEPRPPLRQRPTNHNPLTTSLDSVEWNKHAPNASARPTLEDEANDRGVMMAMREDVDKLSHQLDSTLDDIYQMEVGNGVMGGQIPRTMPKERRAPAPPRTLRAPAVKIARQQSPQGQENEKERTPRTKMKRLLQIQEQSWSPSSRTATANLSKVKPEVFTNKSKKKVNAEARRKQEARSRELSNPNRYKKSQLENLTRMGGGEASDEEGEGEEDDEGEDKTPNVSVSFADERSTVQVYDDSLFDLLEELESVEN